MDLNELQGQALAAVAAAGDSRGLEDVRVRFLGQKGEITGLLKELGALPPEEKKVRGAAIHAVRGAFQAAFDAKKAEVEAAELADALARDAVDVTLPGGVVYSGRIHPLTAAMEEIADSLKRLGFVHAYGPEIETDDYNFTKLNLPEHHPARQDQDTFYVTMPEGSGDKAGHSLLRTQTSNVQIRTLEQYAPPFRVMGIGRVYRRDYDLTHTPQFHQVEGMAVEPGLHFGHMKGVLEEFMRLFFNSRMPVRWRPHYFPFTEPSAELDIQCVFCKGKGCRVCKQSGWLEVLGCGMTHRNVMMNSPAVREALAAGEKSEINGGNLFKFPAFAFGAGVERLAMLKYGIGDLRLFFESYAAFVEHFGKPAVTAA